ncbi:MAG: hypothetical protein ACK5XP_03785 [Sphingobacteriia bacterium]
MERKQADLPTSPPRVPLSFFYHRLSPGGKQLFRIAWLTLALAVALLVLADQYPAQWAVPVQPDSLHKSEPVVLETVEHNYRAINILANATYSFTTYGAGMLSPQPWMIWVLAGFLLIGWSLLLVASTRLEGLALYAFYFFYILYTYGSGTSERLLGNPSPYLSLVPAFLFLGPAYYFKLKPFKINVLGQFLIFVGLHIFLFTFHYIRLGLGGVHAQATTGHAVLLILAFVFMLLCSKDLMAAYVYLATNAATPKRRLAPRWLFLIGLGLLVLQLPPALALMGVLPGHWLWVSPMLLLGLAALLTVFTSQNAYHQVQDLVRDNLHYCLLILGLGILGTATLAYDFMLGEMSLRLAFYRLTAVAFVATGLGYLFYLWANFGDLLLHRVPLYYLLMKPRRVRFAAVWFMAVVFLVMLEGMGNWYGYRAVRATQLNQRADQALLAGQIQDEVVSYRGIPLPGQSGAISLYEAAMSQVGSDPKANLNLAALKIGLLQEITPGDEANEILRHYELAGHARDFRFTALNYGRLLAQLGYIDRAKAQLKTYTTHIADERVYANLAALYYYTGDPDSTLYYLKKGLETNMNNALLYANMAAVYHDWNRPEQALRFAEAGYKAAPQNPAAQQNHLFMLLRYGKKPGPPEPLDTELAAAYPAQAYLNQALALYRAGKLAAADQATDQLNRSLAQQDQSLPDAQLMRLITRARMDSLEQVRSHYQYIEQFHPKLKGAAAHVMGVFAYRHNALPTARHYFLEAASEGQDADSLMAAFTLLDEGYHEEGYQMLQSLNLQSPAYRVPIQQEMAVLDSVYGIPAAFIPWNFENMTEDLALRMAHYAGIRHKPHIAVQALQPLVEQNPKGALPYLEMGWVYAQLGEQASAREQYQAGLKQQPGHPGLQLAMANSWLADSQAAKADPILQRLKPVPDVWAARARMHLLRADTAQAIQCYQQALKQDTLNLAWHQALAELYAARGLPLECYRHWSACIRLDAQNPKLLERYAWAAWGIGFEKDSRLSLELAIAQAVTPAERTRLETSLKKLEAEIHAQNFKPIE